MDPRTFPTKGNLMLAKNSLTLAKQGYELMDKKRNILIRELMDLIDEARDIQDEIDSTFTYAYQCLQRAISSMVSTWSLRLPIPFRLKTLSPFRPEVLWEPRFPRKIHPFRACADLRFQYNPRERRPGCRCIPKSKRSDGKTFHGGKRSISPCH